MPEATPPAPRPAFGLIVIGRNEGARLAACLASLAEAGAPIVYADSGSTDGSVECAARAGATVVPLDPARPLNAARGRGEGFDRLLADHPALDYVQFLDGDCLLQRGWIERALASFADHPRTAVVFGRRFEAHPEASLYNRMCDAEWDTPLGRAEACGGDAMMRVSAYRAVGGFRTDLMAGEEPELCARLRAADWEIWRIDAPMTEHDAAIATLGQWSRRSLRGGFGYAQVWRATRALPAPLYGRQLRSALVWTVLVPVVVVGLAAITGRALLMWLIPLLFSLQVARIALRGGGGGFAWQRAALFMFGKTSEAIGALRYFARPAGHSIGYKAT